MELLTISYRTFKENGLGVVCWVYEVLGDDCSHLNIFKRSIQVFFISALLDW